MDTSIILIQSLNGLQLGVLLFLLSAGLTLTFGIMDLINLAHASFYMLGAFFCASLTVVTGSFLLAVVLACALTALLAAAVEYGIVQKLYARNHLEQVLATFGLILCFDTLVHLLWGPAGLAIGLPDWLNGQVSLGEDLVFPLYRLLIIGVGVVVALGIYVLVSHTRIGMLIRAGASNREMVGALGVDIKLLFAAVFTLGSVLAALAGMLIAPITEASIGMGNEIIITAFVVVIIGGIGSIKGAFVAALLIGMIDTFGRSFLDQFFALFMSVDAAETAAPAISAMLIYILMAIILSL
ncbi:MAG: branched-chain amino acid ABC transporter permease, partial [Gammaproteobacteria bacterium]|nr:branched-chain amino acid ABC transporter permease [Gammaproteobacteria bacterium]